MIPGLGSPQIDPHTVTSDVSGCIRKVAFSKVFHWKHDELTQYARSGPQACILIIPIRSSHSVIVRGKTVSPKLYNFTGFSELCKKGGLVEAAGARPVSLSGPLDGAARRADRLERFPDPRLRRSRTASAKELAKQVVNLIKVNNRYSSKTALRNADLLIRERVDIAIEFQTYENVAPVIATFLGRHTRDRGGDPHPGAVYFATIMKQLVRALGKWAKENWTV